MFKKAVILNDTSFESHHGSEMVINNIKELLLINNIKTIGTNPAGIDFMQNKIFLDNMSISDIVIVNGEGTLHHNQPRALELINVVKYVREKLNIPIVLINSTYQSNSIQMAKLMKYFDLIFVRETLSQNDLKRYDIYSEVVPDITFYSRYDNVKRNLDREGIAVTDSVYLDKSEALYDLAIKNNITYIPILAHKKSFGVFARVEDILRICLRVFRFSFWKFGFNYNHTIVRQFYYTKNHSNYVNRISNLKFVIVGRYHSLCFALKTYTPFIAIKSNSHKIEGLLDDIGINKEYRVKKIKDINLAFDNLSEQEVYKIKEYIDDAPLKIENMFLAIKKLLVKYENSL